MVLSLDHVDPDVDVQRAPDCDMAVVHDDDLVSILGVGDVTVSEGCVQGLFLIPPCLKSLESLQPEVVMDYLQRSKLEIKVMCGEHPPASQPPPIFLASAPTQ